MIASASSGEQGVVTLWQSKKLFAASSSPRSTWSLYRVLGFAVRLVMVLATISFFFQSLGFRVSSLLHG